jgi:HD superfamily phosphohydrolase YqeK
MDNDRMKNEKLKMKNMNHITTLSHLVRNFYESHRNTWIPYWTEYLYEHHIFFVADLSERLSEEFKVNPEFSMAASLLHDIADAVVDRIHPDHMKISEDTALDLLEKS